MANNISLIDAADYPRYDALLADYLAGRVAESAFVAGRLLLGIYGQRQQGLCMVRTKIPGGRLPVAHLPGYAEVLERHSKHDVVHLTTRQDIQFYHVPLEKTAQMQRDLGRFGIATREAGGNTVRNVTACPLAGICPAEEVDVGVHARAISAYFARNPLTESLPRKFKIAISGCAGDCAQPGSNDLGITAVTQGSRRGFRLLVGGGLGATPRTPVVLQEFVDEEELLPSIEAIVALHDRHSDRTRRGRSRIKFLVQAFGPEGLCERFAREAARARGAFDASIAPRGAWRTPEVAPRHVPDAPRVPVAQHQGARFAVPVRVIDGNLTAAQLRGLHDALRDLRIDELRVTSDQNLVIPHVPAMGVGALVVALEKLGLALPQRGDNVAACPGTFTCQLGITASPPLARLLHGGAGDLRIRISGCRNGCAQGDLADIGLYGKARRHFGRMVPTYVLQLGGGGAVLADDGPEVPAGRVPQAVQRIHEAYDASGMRDFRAWAASRHEGDFARLLGDLIQVREADLDALCVDHGETAPFCVSAARVGECAGVPSDPAEKLKLDLLYERRLRDAYVAKRKLDEAAQNLEAMLALGGRSLLHAVARHGEADAAEPLTAQALALSERIAHWRREQDELSFPSLSDEVDRWLGQVLGLPTPSQTSAAALRAVASAL